MVVVCHCESMTMHGVAKVKSGEEELPLARSQIGESLFGSVKS